MHISQEKLDEFQARMSNWVASQGILFQLRHGGSVQGAQSSFFLWVVRMAARLLILALVVGTVFWIYLSKRVDFSGFRSELNETIAAGLHAEEATAGGIKRSRGSLEIGKITLVGGEQSFFDEAEARSVRTKMGLLDGVLNSWDGDAIKIDKLRMSLKSGAEDAARGAEIFKRLFKESGKFQFSLIDIEQASLDWGYSGVTRGSIEGAKIRALRQDGGWRVSVTGGVFSQNWLQGLEIVAMEIMVLPSGVEFREVKLKRGAGEVNFQARIDGPATAPSLSGSGTMRALSIDSYLAPEVREFVGAALSGTFTLGGTPYGAGGVTMKAQITLEGEDRIELRYRVPLFRSISLVDRLRSYKNVRFRTGRFQLETGGGVAVIKDLWLSAKEVMRLEGDFLVRSPTRAEVDEALRTERTGKGRGDGSAATPVDSGGAGGGQDTTAADEMSLEELAKAARRKGREEDPMDQYTFGSGLNSAEWNAIKDAARVREERIPRLQGVIRLGLNSKAFERAPALMERFPVDSDSGMRWLEIPLDGSIFDAGSPLDAEIMEHSGTAN